MKRQARSTVFARALVASARDFLTWIDDLGLTLQTVTQTDVDRWITEGATRNCTSPAGATANRRTSSSRTGRSPCSPGASATPTSPPTSGRPAHSSCSTATRSPASPPSRRTTSTAPRRAAPSPSAVTPPSCPQRTDRLVGQQAEAAQHLRESQPGQARHRWLFPSRLPGRHYAGHRLSSGLVAHGIDVRGARNTAVLALARDLPAPVLGQILGVHINTAERWTHLAGRNWSTYLEARARALQCE